MTCDLHFFGIFFFKFIVNLGIFGIFSKKSVLSAGGVQKISGNTSTQSMSSPSAPKKRGLEEC